MLHVPRADKLTLVVDIAIQFCDMLFDFVTLMPWGLAVERSPAGTSALCVNVFDLAQAQEHKKTIDATEERKVEKRREERKRRFVAEAREERRKSKRMRPTRGDED